MCNVNSPTRLAGILLGFVLGISSSERARAEEPYVLWAKTWEFRGYGSSAAVSPNGDLYVYAGRDLVRFDPAGRFLDRAQHEKVFFGGIAFDGIGNRYVTGSTRGDDLFELSQVHGLFVAKYGPEDDLLWVRGEQPSIWPDSGATGYAVGVDSDGNVIVGGSLRGRVTLGTSTFEAVYEQSPLLCKYNEMGQLLWAKLIDAHGTVERGAIDPSGNTVICGFLEAGVVDFDGTTLHPGSTGLAYGGDWFIARFKPDGVLDWVQLGYAKFIAVDKQGDIYASWGRPQLGTEGLAKFSPTGDLLWSKTFQGAWGGALALSSGGAPVFTGGFEKTAQFADVTLRTRGGYDFFVAMADPEGNIQWAVSGGGAGHDSGSTVSCDLHGNIYLTGDTSSQAGSFGDVPLVAIPGSSPHTLYAAKISLSPWLKIGAASGVSTLVWPTRATNYVLEASGTIDSGDWSPLNLTPVVTHTDQSVTVDRMAVAQFFRLRKAP
jgi:hypothetical protein